jgi:D-glycero-alpha-D-manno-heptose-7-phosphate kinase
MRISYVGGGTDYPDYFRDSPGGVISAAINQYVYVYSNPLSEIAEEKYRFTYRESESVEHHSQFRHPVVRELMQHLDWTLPVNMGTFADLPSGIGLGGSSAFSVAMVKALESAYQVSSPSRLAKIAIHVERNLLKEPGGYQDQYASAFGGLRSYDFSGNRETDVSECLLDEGSLRYLEARQALIWVGQTRDSSQHSLITIESIRSRRKYLEETFQIYLEARTELRNSKGDSPAIFKTLSRAVKRGWDLKKKFTGELDNRVAQIASLVHESGVESLKLCGAGGSGFILVLAEPYELDTLKDNLDGYKLIQPKFDLEGCKYLI